MKRILPDEMLAAYTKIGATPVRGRYYDKASNSGDGVGVYCVAALGHSGEPGVGMYAMAMELAGFENLYIVGFSIGFDGLALLPGGARAYDIGHADGRAAWDAVKHLAPTT